MAWCLVDVRRCRRTRALRLGSDAAGRASPACLVTRWQCSLRLENERSAATRSRMIDCLSADGCPVNLLTVRGLPLEELFAQSRMVRVGASCAVAEFVGVCVDGFCGGKLRVCFCRMVTSYSWVYMSCNTVLLIERALPRIETLFQLLSFIKSIFRMSLPPCSHIGPLETRAPCCSSYRTQLYFIGMKFLGA